MGISRYPVEHTGILRLHTDDSTYSTSFNPCRVWDPFPKPGYVDYSPELIWLFHFPFNGSVGGTVDMGKGILYTHMESTNSSLFRPDRVTDHNPFPIPTYIGVICSSNSKSTTSGMEPASFYLVYGGSSAIF